MFSKIRVMSKLSPIGMDVTMLRAFRTALGAHTRMTPESVIDSINEIPNDEHSLKPQVVDINLDNMMEEDADGEGFMDEPRRTAQPDGPIIGSKDLDGVHIAPVDINPWIDEEELAEGTVDMERIEKERQPIEYPPLPEKREATTYTFKGIKIRLPSNMLTKATYRYRLDQEDEALADDTHICKYT